MFYDKLIDYQSDVPNIEAYQDMRSSRYDCDAGL